MDVDVVLIIEGGIQFVFRSFSFSSSSSSIGSGHGRVVVRHGWTIVDVTWRLEEEEKVVVALLRFGSAVMVDVGEEEDGCGVQHLGGSDAKEEEEDTTTSTSPSSVDGDDSTTPTATAGRSISE